MVYVCAPAGVFAAENGPNTKQVSPGTDVAAPGGSRISRSARKPQDKPDPAQKTTPPVTTGKTVVPDQGSPVTTGQFHRESPRKTTPAHRKDPAAVTKTDTRKYHVDARVFISGEAARKKGKTGFKQLTDVEKELTAFLGYRDYRLISKGEKTISQGGEFTVNFGKQKSVTVIPLSESPERVKLSIEWKIPGEEDEAWRKLLYFRRNHRSLIGGPHIEGGGMYLLSLEIE
jgi:hypothetical protein